MTGEAATKKSKLKDLKLAESDKKRQNTEGYKKRKQVK